MYLNPIGKKQAIISEEAASEMEAGGDNTREIAMQRMSSRGNPSGTTNVGPTLESATGVAPKRGKVLPFQPLAMSFDSVNYHVDMPAEMKEQGVTDDRLQLLREVTGALRPGVLTALMGVSGAG